MPSKTEKVENAMAKPPSIPKELIDHFVKGPMTGEAVSAPKRGDIISFKPESDAHGHEQQRVRPWLVISVDAYNDVAKHAMLCAIMAHQSTAVGTNPAEVLLLPQCGARRFRVGFPPPHYWRCSGT